MAIFAGKPQLRRASDRNRESLLKLGSDRHYAAGQQILRQGNDDQFVALIQDGWTAVRIEASNGRSVIFGLCGPMDVIGEMAAFDEAPRSAAVTALVDVRARTVAAADFLDFLMPRPDAYEAAVRPGAADDLARRSRCVKRYSGTPLTLAD